VTGKAVPKIDRSKLREAIRKLGDEFVFYLLDDALDLVPESKLATLVGTYLDVKGLRLDAGARIDLFAEVETFKTRSLAGGFYEDFKVNSKNCMQLSRGTRAWIAQCCRLFDSLVEMPAKSDAAKVAAAFEVLFDLLRRIDAAEEILFFADEGGSWQVGVDWTRVLPAWFKCLSRTASAEVYAHRVERVVEGLGLPGRAGHLQTARRLATPAQRKALFPPSRGVSSPEEKREERHDPDDPQHDREHHDDEGRVARGLPHRLLR
jgi:hypothetical protein